MNKQIRILVWTVLGFAGLFSMANFSQAQAQGQNASSSEFEAIRTSLDQAIQAFEAGNASGALQQLDRTEDQMDMIEDRLEFQLGIYDD
jgi:predicted negative regulator of RcsB-dependent stress response